jgi:hypothetical protein
MAYRDPIDHFFRHWMQSTRSTIFFSNNSSVLSTEKIVEDTCALETAAASPCPTPTVYDGPAILFGDFTYTNDIVLERYYVEHAVGLVDMTGFVLRDQEWELPVEAQTLGFMQVDTKTKGVHFGCSCRLSLKALSTM